MRQLYQFLVFWQGQGTTPKVQLSVATNPLQETKRPPLKVVTWMRVDSDVFVYWWGENVEDKYIKQYFDGWLDAWKGNDAAQS